MEYFVKCFKNYMVFQGRARRKEYWMFALFNFVIGTALSSFATASGQESLSLLSYVYSLAVILPDLSVSVRRLHDVGKSGWWLFIMFVPLFGALYLLYLTCVEGDKGDNQYGPDPKALDK